MVELLGLDELTNHCGERGLAVGAGRELEGLVELNQLVG